MSESNGSPESSANLLESSQLVQDSTDNVQQSSSLDSHDTQSSSSENTDLCSIVDDSRDTLLGTRLNKPSLLDATNVPLESPSEISGSSPTLEYSVEHMDTSSPESTITGDKHTVNREHIHQPSTESKRESDISLEVGKHSFRVDASQEPSVSEIHLESFKSNRREHSVEKSQHLTTSASLEKINKSEKRKFSPKKTYVQYEETASESVEFNLIETTIKVTTKNVGKVLDVCPQLSQPGLFSPSTTSDTSSGFCSPTYQRKKARTDNSEDDLQISDMSNSPKSEVSETSTTEEKVQRSENVGNLAISQEPIDPEATQLCGEISICPSQSIKETIELSSDSSETEVHSSESICMPASEEAKVGTSVDAAASTSQMYVSSFIDYTNTNKEFENKVKDVIDSFKDDIIFRHALYETACKKQTQNNLFLMADIYKDFLRAKVFLLTLFSSDLITENKIRQGFCISSEPRDLDLEDEFRKVIPRENISCLEIMWCQYFVVVDFLIRNSGNIFIMFKSTNKDPLLYYSELCSKFNLFLRKSMNKINGMKHLRHKNGNDDFKHFGDLNLALRAVIIKLEGLLIDFEKHVRNIVTIDLSAEP